MIASIVTFVLSFVTPGFDTYSYDTEGKMITLSTPATVKLPPPRDILPGILLFENFKGAETSDINACARHLRETCVRLELLEPERAQYYFRGPFENENDFCSFAPLYQKLKDAPRDSDKQRFGWAIQGAYDYVLKLTALKRDLKAQMILFPDRPRPFLDEIERIDGYIELWQAVSALKGSPLVYRRIALNTIRETLTAEEWASGQLPRLEE